MWATPYPLTVSDNEPVRNAAFSRAIVWRVLNEQVSPRRIGSHTIWTTAGISTWQSYERPRSEKVTLAANIAGRDRFNVLAAQPAIFEAVSPDRTFQAASTRYPRRLPLWGIPWLTAYTLASVALSHSFTAGFIALFAVTVLTSWSLSDAVVDFSWWAGHGFAAETTARRAIAATLWLLDAAPLVLLQMLLLK